MTGTFLTLLPVGIDFLRKYYVRRFGLHMAWGAFNYFDITLAVIFALGFTLMGVGFAIQFTHPEHR
jgi:hypothetical protein